MTNQDFGRIARKTLAASFHLFAAIGRGIEAMRRYEALRRLPDSELAALGIAREDIARHVAGCMAPETHHVDHTADLPLFKAAANQDTAAIRRHAA